MPVSFKIYLYINIYNKYVLVTSIYVYDWDSFLAASCNNSVSTSFLGI